MGFGWAKARGLMLWNNICPPSKRAFYKAQVKVGNVIEKWRDEMYLFNDHH
jgi:hypothetical protein